MISLGLRTLLAKEVRRFLRVPGQTLASPLVTTTLYFLVFGWSIGHQLSAVDGVPYARFIVPGLVVMGVVQNAYLNSASSLFVMKLQGTIVDLLVSPLAYWEILAGFVGAAVLRGLLVGGITWVVAGLFTGFEVAHPLLAAVMIVLVAVVFAGMGVASAIWAQSFEQVNFFPTFFILPLTFLGGVFYSARALPPALEPFTRANPVFYMVDAVRYGMLGISDARPAVGVGLVSVLAAGALICPYLLLRSGWRLRT
ncbi:MAG: ABC transporter permease [Anaeromyxobacteraceae bacterium]|nr:ABC transporter permease [Anaeromyxobacteraceae bacterium]